MQPSEAYALEFHFPGTQAAPWTSEPALPLGCFPSEDLPYGVTEKGRVHREGGKSDLLLSQTLVHTSEPARSLNSWASRSFCQGTLPGCLPRESLEVLSTALSTAIGHLPSSDHWHGWDQPARTGGQVLR